MKFAPTKLAWTPIILLMAAGCATNIPASSPKVAAGPRLASPAVATALAFDPPVTSHINPALLWRDDREPAAFAGYQELNVEYYDLQTIDDQFYDDGNSTYERDAQSERIGVTYR